MKRWVALCTSVLALTVGAGNAAASGLPTPPAASQDAQQSQQNSNDGDQTNVLVVAPQVAVQNTNVQVANQEAENNQGDVQNSNVGNNTNQGGDQAAQQSGGSGSSQASDQSQKNANDADQVNVVTVAPQTAVAQPDVRVADRQVSSSGGGGNSQNSNVGNNTIQGGDQSASQRGSGNGCCGGSGTSQASDQSQKNYNDGDQKNVGVVAPQVVVQNTSVQTLNGSAESNQGDVQNSNVGHNTKQGGDQTASQRDYSRSSCCSDGGQQAHQSQYNKNDADQENYGVVANQVAVQNTSVQALNRNAESNQGNVQNSNVGNNTIQGGDQTASQRDYSGGSCCSGGDQRASQSQHNYNDADQKNFGVVATQAPVEGTRVAALNGSSGGSEGHVQNSNAGNNTIQGGDQSVDQSSGSSGRPTYGRSESYGSKGGKCCPVKQPKHECCPSSDQSAHQSQHNYNDADQYNVASAFVQTAPFVTGGGDGNVQNSNAGNNTIQGGDQSVDQSAGSSRQPSNSSRGSYGSRGGNCCSDTDQTAKQYQYNKNDADQKNIGSAFVQTAPFVSNGGVRGVPANSFTVPGSNGGGGNVQNSNAGNNTIQGGDQSVDQSSGSSGRPTYGRSESYGSKGGKCCPVKQPKHECCPSSDQSAHQSQHNYNDADQYNVASAFVQTAPFVTGSGDGNVQNSNAGNNTIQGGDQSVDQSSGSGSSGKPSYGKSGGYGSKGGNCCPSGDQSAKQYQVNKNDADQYNVASSFTQTDPFVSNGGLRGMATDSFTVPGFNGGGGNVQNSNAGNNTIQGGDQSVDQSSGSGSSGRPTYGRSDRYGSRGGHCCPSGDQSAKQYQVNKNDADQYNIASTFTQTAPFVSNGSPIAGAADSFVGSGGGDGNVQNSNAGNNTIQGGDQSVDQSSGSSSSPAPMNGARGSYGSKGGGCCPSGDQSAKQYQVNKNDADQYNVASSFTQTAPFVTGSGDGNVQNSNAGNNTIQGGDQSVDQHGGSGNFSHQSKGDCPPKDDCPPKEQPKDDCPPKEQPKDDCPPKEEPKDDCPPKEEPKDDCPPKEEPKDDCPPKEQPKDDCPPKEQPKDDCPPKEQPKDDCPPKHEYPARHTDGQTAHQGQVNYNDADQYNVASAFTQTAPFVSGGNGNTQNSNAGNNTIQGGDQSVDQGTGSKETGGVPIPV
jgi:hypothetical protein